MSGGVDDFLKALPKVELHVHLVGSASIPTVMQLGRRHGGGRVPTDPAELAEFYRFRDFAHFIEVYQKVNELVTTPDDVTDLVTGIARDVAVAGVRYAEITVTPMSQVHAGIEPAAVARALEDGRDAARELHGVELGWIFDVPGEFGPEWGRTTLDWVLTHRPEGTVGFGLGGPEVGVPRSLFAEYFRTARAEGLHSLPHAGETTGPESVWSALRDLGAERIGHGLHAVEDERLLDHLVEHRIPLEVCPTSNLRTGEVADLADHPLPVLHRRGVPVTINTDDPGMFGCDLLGEYRAAHDRMGLTPAELADIARAAVDAAYCTPELKAQLHAGIDAVPLPG